MLYCIINLIVWCRCLLPVYFRLIPVIIFAIALLPLPAAAFAGNLSVQPAQLINVLVTINPLYIAVKEAFADKINVELLMPASSSPHHFTLKPSDALKLNSADLVIWVGPELEQSLVKLIAKRAPSDSDVFSALQWLQAERSSSLLKVNQLRRSKVPEKFNSHDHLHGVQHEHGHAGNHIDPHFWLSRDLVASVIQGINLHLGERYPAMADALQQSADRYTSKLKSLALAQPTIDKEFISYHNGFDYLAREAGLSITDVMTTNPEIKPGAGHLAAIREKLQSGNICFITEPQFKRGILVKLLQGNSSDLIELDPIGRGFNTYSDYLKSLYKKLTACGAAG